jgi:hypothetical protein
MLSGVNGFEISDIQEERDRGTVSQGERYIYPNRSA